jgi:uncharacterized membrane protein YoaK (UPF0700 family)
VAGYVDAVAFFGLGVFTANMTGNTVLLAGAIAGRFGAHVPGAIGLGLPLISLAGFAAGAGAAAAFLRREIARPPVRARIALSTVAALLAIGAAIDPLRHPQNAIAAVAVLSAVMGVQSVVAVRAGVPGVSTTFVTGTLVRSIVDALGTPAATPQLHDEARTNAWVWACYLAGATAGAVALRAMGAPALWIPAGVVALLLPMV